MRLIVFKEVATRVPRARLMRLFDIVCKGEKAARMRGCVNLVFVGDARIKKLNSQFRSIDRATDVLSFNLDVPDEPDDVFGEVYISKATATRQAKELRSSLAAEYLRLACHGFMHLMGYDHQDPDERSEMEEREIRYLTSLRNEGHKCSI